VPRSDGTVLVGATVEEVGFDESATDAGRRTLVDAVHTLLPVTRGARVVSMRVGLRPASPDDMPIIGRLPDRPRVVVATGHFRNGVLLAPITADLVSRLVLDGTEDPALVATSPARLPHAGLA
jgi:glycine oxidase